LQDASSALKEVSAHTETIIAIRAGKSFSAATTTNRFFHLFRGLGLEGWSSPNLRKDEPGARLKRQVTASILLT
tara:strand:- start:1432 stop:1653 length:222 start_codon:yes stop_codon:yes gene_type:complete